MNAKDNCDHDWRINPYKILTSNPPRREIKCILCGALGSIGTRSRPQDRNDMSKWPKYSTEQYERER